MAKAYPAAVTEKLREQAKTLLKDRYDNNAAQLAKGLKVSAGYVSDFIAGNRGAGWAMLTGIARLDPLSVLDVLGIDVSTVLNLVAHGGDRQPAGEDRTMRRLPAPVVRAMRAAIEITGCVADDAVEAAYAAFDEFGELPNTTVDWWLAQIRERLPKRSASGTRPSVTLRAAKKR